MLGMTGKGRELVTPDDRAAGSRKEKALGPRLPAGARGRICSACRLQRPG